MARTSFNVSNLYALGAASDLVFLHQTHIFTVLVVARVAATSGTAYTFAASGAGTSQKGFRLFYNSANPSVQLNVYEGTAGLNTDLYFAASTTPDTGWHSYAFTANAGAGGRLGYIDGAASAIAGSTKADVTGDATNATLIGYLPGGGQALATGAIARFAAAPYAATADEMRALTLGYPLPRRMRSSTAVDVRFGESPGDLFKGLSLTATGTPTKADSPRSRDEERPRLHQPQRGLARRMALEGLYVGSAR